LIRVIYDGGATIDYSYDAAGNRTQVVRSATPPSSVFTATIPITGAGPVNLRGLADAAGYNGAQSAAVTYTLASGVTITGSPGGGAGINTGSWPTGSHAITLTLQISGAVRGGGGTGGNGATGMQPGQVKPGFAGGAGGHAINCQAPISITVNAGGLVQSGGGGGRGGDGYGGDFPEPIREGGGGGGGGAPNGAGGAGGGGESPGGPGNSGTTSGGGAGGSGYQNGFAGGTYGVAGGGATGGAAGYAIRKNGQTVTVTNNGTITGTVG
jgi:hypothetical protein